MINSISRKSKHPIRSVIGCLTLLALTACQTTKTPLETTQAFWSAVVENKLYAAQKLCSEAEHKLPASLSAEFQNVSFDYGKIVIDGNLSSVEVTLLSPSQKSSFTTFMLLEEETWKIDCLRSTTALTGSQVFEGFLNGLNTIGKKINQQLEQQLPIIEKEIESFGKELQQQLDDFGNELEKSFPKEQQKTHQNTI